MDDQYSIVEDKNLSRIGNTYTVLVEEYDAYADCYVGRTYMDAPEIDGEVAVSGAERVLPGDMIRVRITGSSEYDLSGEMIHD